jgi:3',5'-cyclic AMP phosphodiesterase CpdA
VTAQPQPRLLALSDLHVGYPENRQLVSELFADIEWVLSTLSGRFAQVIWTPGNHELWTRKKDPVQLRGEARYLALVELCRSLGISTPEDPYLVWPGPAGAGPAGTGPVTIAPVFLLYDYSFRPEGALTKEQGLAVAYKTGVVCSDEALLFPDPYPSREAWCWARIEARRAGPGAACGVHEPLPPGPGPDPDLALPAVRPVVRHDAYA